jgi:porphobilinogen synthase
MKPLKLERAEGTPRPAAPESQFLVPGGYPNVRLRRNRKSGWSRRLVAENVLTTADLIWPIFLIDSQDARTPVAHMPGVDRLNIA